MRQISLKGKVAVITGASSGFGESAAIAFAREGCRVVLAARRVERLEQIADRIRTGGGEALVVPLDVSSQPGIDALAKEVMKEFGQVDILFNNAGFGRLDWLETLDPLADINTQLDVNLKGTIQVTRVFLPHMIRQRSGVIINMSSVAGWIPSPLFTIYSATKFGLRGFTEALRREVRPFGIQVCGIYPGGAATEFGSHTGNAQLRKDIKTPARLRLSADYVAKKVVGLARHPRRRLILPWWMGVGTWIEVNFPWLVDAAVGRTVRKYHQG